MNDGADKNYQIDFRNLRPQPNFLETMFMEKRVPEEVLNQKSKAIKEMTKRQSRFHQAQLQD
jgi:hypothetical protein